MPEEFIIIIISADVGCTVCFYRSTL